MDFNKLFEYRDGELFWKVDRAKIPAGDKVGWVDKDGYLLVTLPPYLAETASRVFKVHRIIWEMHNGVIARNLVIDHIDGNVANNKLENLRVATMRENHRNKKAVASSSPLKGAIKQGNRWRSRIRLDDGTRISLGSFATAEEAHQAYSEAAIKYFGDFARTS